VADWSIDGVHPKEEIGGKGADDAGSGPDQADGQEMVHSVERIEDLLPVHGDDAVGVAIGSSVSEPSREQKIRSAKLT